MIFGMRVADEDSRMAVLRRRALTLIGWAFAALAVYLLVQSTVVLAAGYHPRPTRPPGTCWSTTPPAKPAVSGAPSAPA